jgi:RNA polymerase II subunit A small phosphatase-like protein
VAVREFLGDPADIELRLLSAYLKQLVSVPNVRAIEKRHWREQMLLADA